MLLNASNASYILLFQKICCLLNFSPSEPDLPSVYRSLDNAGEKTFLPSPPLIYGFSITITEIPNIHIVSKAGLVSLDNLTRML